MRLLFLILAFFNITVSIAQQGKWVAQLHREDGNNIPFSFDWKMEKGKQVWYIKNALEKIRVDNIKVEGDSFIVQMPVFESQFRFTLKNNNISGIWLKGGALKTLILPFSATMRNKRFPSNAVTKKNISGRWAVKFGPKDSIKLSVAEFIQKGNLLTGTFLNATGDYRFLEGIVTKDTLLLSCFDGEHAYSFKALIENDTIINYGIFYSGARGKKEWTATKDSNAKVTHDSVAMFLKPGEERLDFSFKDLEGKQVSINSDRFKNKVVVVQLMGSWCPNCMDETIFLSDYYNKNKHRGVEVVALAYEYSTDWERSVNSLKKFQQRFNVQYPILITGVTSSDSLRTEKTLPQVTRIKFFPSSIIIDKKGKIRQFDTGFVGPATGSHYIEYKKEFDKTIDSLLKEN